ncbi:MAG: three-Cys-motif partner protein TcmP [Lysobacteraceae bacterium]
MAKNKRMMIEVDPGDGLNRSIVGEWSKEKIEYLVRYVQTSSATRRKWKQYGRSAFIDLYSGSGRSRIDGTADEIVDGGVIAAVRQGLQSQPFDQIVIGDLDPDLVDAAKQRLLRLGPLDVTDLGGPAESTVDDAIRAIDPKGLHLAYLDPFSVHALPFSIIQKLGRVPHIDLMIHFSVLDYRRNLTAMCDNGKMDSVAPGWQRVITSNMGLEDRRRRIFEHWKGLIESLGYHTSEVVPVAATGKADYYWLVLVGKHELIKKFWNVATDTQTQMSLI